MKTKPLLRAWLFGSYTCGEETPESDIDILGDYDIAPSVRPSGSP